MLFRIQEMSCIEENQQIKYPNEQQDKDTGCPICQKVIQQRYSYLDTELPIEYITKNAGETFLCIQNNRTTALETFILDMKLHGPCWLYFKNIQKNTKNQNSWCIEDWYCDTPLKDISIILPDNKIYKAPLLNLLSLSIQVIQQPIKNINDKDITNTAIIIGICYTIYKLIDIENYNKITNINKKNITTKILWCLPTNDIVWPYNFSNNCKDKNIVQFSKEEDMLEYFLNDIELNDPDILLSHRLHSYVQDILQYRLKTYNKQKNIVWSKIGRQKRTILPTVRKSTVNSNIALDMGIGRILIDTEVSSKEFSKSCTNYTLVNLCKVLLNKEYKEIEQNDILLSYSNTNKQIDIIDSTVQDTIIQLEISDELQLQLLSRQLCEICGNTWNRILRSGISERIEYMQQHECFSKNIIPPDRLFRNYNQDKTKYLGGLVQDAKRGYYTTYIALLDFNSLYPSIIREYNICFTTRNYKDNNDIISFLHRDNKVGLLPSIMTKQIEKRKQVRSCMLKNPINCIDNIRQDIQQKAYKQIANAMYGCLGSQNTRFYNTKLASYITKCGRDAQQKAVDVATNLKVDILYGDTDSIMLDTKMNEYLQAKQIAIKVKEAINQYFSIQHIDEDTYFYNLLLLAKKKYVGQKYIQECKKNEQKILENNGIINKNSIIRTVDGIECDDIDKIPSEELLIILKKEVRGQEQIRRDFCPLVHRVLTNVIDILQSGRSQDDIIYRQRQYQTQIQSWQKYDIARKHYKEYIITKKQTQSPENYTQINELPHVQVAQWYMKRQGVIIRANTFIEYIITCGTGNISQRAVHPQRLLEDETLQIDIDFYRESQLYQPQQRQCIVQGNSIVDDIATWQGIKPSNQQHTKNHIQHNQQKYNILNSTADTTYIQDELTRYSTEQNIQKVVCMRCGIKYPFAGQCMQYTKKIVNEYINDDINKIIMDENDALDIFYNTYINAQYYQLNHPIICKKREEQQSSSGQQCPRSGCYPSSILISNEDIIDDTNDKKRSSCWSDEVYYFSSLLCNEIDNAINRQSHRFYTENYFFIKQNDVGLETKFIESKHIEIDGTQAIGKQYTDKMAYKTLTYQVYLFNINTPIWCNTIDTNTVDSTTRAIAKRVHEHALRWQNLSRFNYIDLCALFSSFSD